MSSFNESDLYAPLKAFFESRGYLVKGEVNKCDMALIKGNELLIVELKKNFNMSLIYQALDRQRIAHGVYVALPLKAFMRKKRHILNILEKLNMGLVTVAMDSELKACHVHIMPNMAKKRDNKKSRALINEFNNRNFDNTGGAVRQKLMTAHREKSICIALALSGLASATAPILIKEHNCPKSTGLILSRNTYGWFERKEKGVYALSKEGKEAIANPDYKEILMHYAEIIKAKVKEGGN